MPQNNKKLFVGLKLGENATPQFVQEVKEHVDFFELYAAPDASYKFLEGTDIPITIHIAHFGTKVNFSNPKREQENLVALRHAVALANKFDAIKIIFHPELKEDDGCSVEALTKFISKNYDERLYLENMPYSSEGFVHFGADPAEVKILLDKLNVKFCFDFAHALEYLKYKGKDTSALAGFINLEPGHFHLTDTDLAAVTQPNYNEQHVSFGDGNVDLPFCKDLIPKDAWVTIETPMNTSKQLREIDFLRS